jgi:aldehyde dehydrogenase (NAD+)
MPVEATAIGAVQQARPAQAEWLQVPLRERLRVIRKLRHAIAAEGLDLCELFPDELARDPAQSLTAEIIPLADACRFLEREAEQILAPRRVSKKSRPFWMSGVELELQRDPLGVVLIVAPANYPLFIAGVQAVQALASGNAVLLKPGRGCSTLAAAFRSLALKAGVPEKLFQLLPEQIESVQAAIAGGIDKVFVTGSRETGWAVYGQAADQLIPAVLELSGADPVFIQAGADLDRAAKAILFGRRWNNGNTCIVPRRIFVHESISYEFEQRLRKRSGSRIVDLPITRFRNDDHALHLAAQSHYALGASVFGDRSTAESFASRVNAGVVVLNDIIAPTADPRIPFGGRGWSGFGTTRGAEGLLEFTTLKAVVTQTARRLRHLEPLPENATELFAAYLAAVHQMPGKRLRAWQHLLSTLLRQSNRNTKYNSGIVAAHTACWQRLLSALIRPRKRKTRHGAGSVSALKDQLP